VPDVNQPTKKLQTDHLHSGDEYMDSRDTFPHRDERVGGKPYVPLPLNPDAEPSRRAFLFPVWELWARVGQALITELNLLVIKTARHFHHYLVPCLVRIYNIIRRYVLRNYRS
jgi:hypothetical protein